MNRFAPILARLNQRLVLPQPLKYRIMKEIAADLEDTFDMYLQKGIGESDAEAKALEKIAADDSVINDLIEVHETPIRKMLRKLSDKTQYRMEAGLWISLLVLAGILVAGLLTRSKILAGSPFNWLTGGFIIGMFGISVTKYYELFIKKNHSLKCIHRELPLLIFISCLAVLTGTLGFFVEIQESIHTTMMSGSEWHTTAVTHLLRSFSVTSLSFATAVIGAVVWLIMTLKILTVEDQEHAFQFQETGK